MPRSSARRARRSDALPGDTSVLWRPAADRQIRRDACRLTDHRPSPGEHGAVSPDPPRPPTAEPHLGLRGNPAPRPRDLSVLCGCFDRPRNPGSRLGFATSRRSRVRSFLRPETRPQTRAPSRQTRRARPRRPGITRCSSPQPRRGLAPAGPLSVGSAQAWDSRAPALGHSRACGGWCRTTPLPLDP